MIRLHIMKKVLLCCTVCAMLITLSACSKKEDGSASVNFEVGRVGKEDVKTSEKEGMMEKVVDKMRGGQKCVLKENDKVVSTVYMNGERMRADGDGSIFDDTSSGGASSMINDGEWVYMWDHAEKKGMKMKIEKEHMDEVANEEDEIDEYSEGDVERLIADNDDRDLDYACEKWKVDEKMFIPPTDVEFTDMQEMMDNMVKEMSGGEDMPKDAQIPSM